MWKRRNETANGSGMIQLRETNVPSRCKEQSIHVSEPVASKEEEVHMVVAREAMSQNALSNCNESRQEGRMS